MSPETRATLSEMVKDEFLDGLGTLFDQFVCRWRRHKKYPPVGDGSIVDRRFLTSCFLAEALQAVARVNSVLPVDPAVALDRHVASELARTRVECKKFLKSTR